MSDKKFQRWIAVISVLGCLSLLALLAYSWYLHQDCSVISYIANKG